MPKSADEIAAIDDDALADWLAVEPGPAPEPEPENGPEVGDGLTVAVDAPFYVHTFTYEIPEGDTLVIDRRGVWVSAEHLDQVLTAAATSGVTLKVE